MKKTGLFKIIMFMLLGMIVATYIFESSYFQEGQFSVLTMNYTGLFDAFSMFFKSLLVEYFAQVLIIVLAIGALYGVIEKTGVYRKLVNNIVTELKGREFLFIVLSSLFIAVLTSVFDYGFALMIFFPFIISILLAMGYDKVTVAAATFGSMLIGTIGSTVGYNTSTVIAKVLEIKTNVNFYYKLALLLISYVALLIFLSKAKRHKPKEEDLKDVDIFADEFTAKKQSVKPVVIILIVIFVLLILGCTNWESTFKITFFNTIHEKVTGFEPKLPYLHITPTGIETGSEKIKIFGILLGDSAAFGNWYYSEMAIVCFFASLLLGLIYKINAFDGMKNGIKKMLKPAGMLLLSYVVLYFAANQMFYPTIAQLLLSITSKFSVVISSIIMAIASVFHVDVLFVANYAAPQIVAKTSNAPLIALITQSIYGVVMFIAPTSIYLTFGLTYLNLPYKTWVKRIWKLVIALLVIVLAILLIAKFV